MYKIWWVSMSSDYTALICVYFFACLIKLLCTWGRKKRQEVGLQICRHLRDITWSNQNQASWYISADLSQVVCSQDFQGWEDDLEDKVMWPSSSFQKGNCLKWETMFKKSFPLRVVVFGDECFSLNRTYIMI